MQFFDEFLTLKQQSAQFEVVRDFLPDVFHILETEQVFHEEFKLSVFFVPFIVCDRDAIGEMHDKVHCFIINYN